MKNYKFSIILFYYERNNLVMNSLLSIKNSTYKNWELYFLDDGSINEGRPIVENILKDDLNKIIFDNTNMSKEDKINNDGSMIGFYANNYLSKTDSDYCIVLCDDDFLHPNYLEKLNRYYNNSDDIHIYSHMLNYNPEIESYYDCWDISNRESEYNIYTEPINGYHKLDMSMVSWKRKTVLDDGIGFPYPKTISLDEDFFQQLYDKYGGCKFSGFHGQYKGRYDDQLIFRQWDVNKIYELKNK